MLPLHQTSIESWVEGTEVPFLLPGAYYHPVRSGGQSHLSNRSNVVVGLSRFWPDDGGTMPERVDDFPETVEAYLAPIKNTPDPLLGGLSSDVDIYLNFYRAVQPQRRLLSSVGQVRWHGRVKTIEVATPDRRCALGGGAGHRPRVLPPVVSPPFYARSFA